MKNRIILSDFFTLLTVLLAIAIAVPEVNAQTGVNNQLNSHRGAVTAILADGKGRIISSGEDGFMQIWNQKTNTADQRFQIGIYPIRSMALRPEKPEIAFLETNNSGYSRISVWNYETRQKIFSLPFDDNINNMFYSAGGSFLLVTGRNGVTRINSETGAALMSPRGMIGEVNFAATGRSERSMVTYQKYGYLTYWDLETGSTTLTLNVPRDITSPLLLGNNRFLAGFDSGGLLILDAVTGAVLVRDNSIQNGILFTGNPEGLEFICLSPGIPNQFMRYPSVIYHFNYRIQNSRLETVNRRNIPTNMPLVNSGVVISPESAALGTADGRVMTFNKNGAAKLMDTRNQIRIEETASSSAALAFRTEKSELGFIPLDYTELKQRAVIYTEDCGLYTSITAGNSEFILWQSQNTRSFPLIKYIVEMPERGSVSEAYFTRLSLRFPLRSVSIYENLYLFMDTVGNITVINQDTTDVVFTYVSSGAQDAVFIDDQNILIGRSANQGSRAFVMVNIITGETVPLPLSAAMGTKVYRGASGELYGAAISNNYRTSLISINTSNPARSYDLAEIESEDPNFAMAESLGVLAAAIGGEKASLFRTDGLINPVPAALERSSGFPVLLENSGDTIISADSDGNICWHDPLTGKILAVFRLFTDSWTLETPEATISGRVQKR